MVDSNKPFFVDSTDTKEEPKPTAGSDTEYDFGSFQDLLSHSANIRSAAVSNSHRYELNANSHGATVPSSHDAGICEYSDSTRTSVFSFHSSYASFSSSSATVQRSA